MKSNTLNLITLIFVQNIYMYLLDLYAYNRLGFKWCSLLKQKTLPNWIVCLLQFDCGLSIVGVVVVHQLNNKQAKVTKAF